MPNSLPSGKSTASKTVIQFTDNLGLFLFSVLVSSLLSPAFLFYPMAMAYVHGKYPSVKDFQALVFTGRYIKGALVGWLLTLIPIVRYFCFTFLFSFYFHYRQRIV